MKKNIAIGDRFLRFALAIVLLLVFFTSNLATPWNYIALVIGLVFIITAYLGWCPLYSIFHIDTRQFKESDGHQGK